MTRAPTRFSLKIQEFVTVKALIGDGIISNTKHQKKKLSYLSFLLFRNSGLEIRNLFAWPLSTK